MSKGLLDCARLGPGRAEISRSTLPRRARVPEIRRKVHRARRSVRDHGRQRPRTKRRGRIQGSRNGLACYDSPEYQAAKVDPPEIRGRRFHHHRRRLPTNPGGKPPLTSGKRPTMIKLYLRGPYLFAGIAYRAGGCRRRYSPCAISFAAEEQRKPEYLAINPKGRVPALVTDQGILTETPAMLAFIAQSFPRTQGWRRWTTRFSLPRCRPSTAICARRCMWPMPTACAAIAGPTIRPPSRRCSARCRRSGRRLLRADRAPDARGPWVMGETYTICDPYLFTMAQWLEEDGVDPSTVSEGHAITGAGCRNGRSAKGVAGWQTGLILGM